ncbi:MAG: helix-turn-helix domain-containing protein [Actinomycetota bacterium]|nr:helix-turn-helix domain-containing protein [Actinomycetota bacterium]
MDQTNDRDAEIAKTIIDFLAATRAGEPFAFDHLDPDLRAEVEELLPIVLGAVHSAEYSTGEDDAKGWDTSGADADAAAARLGFSPREGTRRLLGARLRELRVRSGRSTRDVARDVSATGATVVDADIAAFENETIAHVPLRVATALIDLFGPSVAYGTDDAPGRMVPTVANSAAVDAPDLTAIVVWVRPDADVTIVSAGNWAPLPVDYELNVNLLGLETHVLAVDTVADAEALAAPAVQVAARLFDSQPQLNAVFVVAGDDGHSTVTLEPADVRTTLRTSGPARPPGRTHPILDFEDALRRFFEAFLPNWTQLDVSHLIADPEPVDEVIAVATRRAVARTKVARAQIPAKQDALATISDTDAVALADLLRAVHAGTVPPGRAVQDRIGTLAGVA